MLEKILAELGLSAEEIKTYTKLLETSGGTAGELSTKFGVSKATLYGVLQRLTDKGLVIRSLKKGTRTFSAEEPENIKNLFNRKISDLKTSLDSFEHILPNLTKKRVNTKPKIQFYEGQQGLQNILYDMLNYRDISTYSYWPISDMIEILGYDFFYYHNKERIRNKLYTKAIWPPGKVIDMKKNPALGAGKNYYREIRITPPEMDFTMGYWIYGNKVAMITSREESFGMIIESSEFKNMMFSQWNVVWNLSKPLKINEQDTKKFIAELLQEGII